MYKTRNILVIDNFGAFCLAHHHMKQRIGFCRIKLPVVRYAHAVTQLQSIHAQFLDRARSKVSSSYLTASSYIWVFCYTPSTLVAVGIKLASISMPMQTRCGICGENGLPVPATNTHTSLFLNSE